ncbi:hypothetical protein E4U43_004249 [Claviceps pusilla]|uniref:CSI2 protein n=1 Tax=Claviceps pusilla TaxID=123648 RepID=A0A9P7T2X2_9HYPO|nr:hypothetical protein E4U43_004249 [Claviceps pusilla]
MRLINNVLPSLALLPAVFLVAPVVAQQATSTATATSPPSTPSDKSSPSETQTSGKTSVTSAPPTSTSSNAGSDNDSGGLTGFPTLTGPGVIPTYAPASVPPTKNAPFMQQSSLPDGTVFIIVGVVLGVLGLALLIWRSFASLMLHRSVERAAMAQHVGDDKTGFPPPPAPFYKYSDQASSMSLGGGGGGAGGALSAAAAAAGRGVRRTNRGPVPSATPSQSNLFFSPTAGAGAASNRASSFLPSGFYAAGTNSPGGANQANSIGLSNLRSDPHGHYSNLSRQTMDVTPPESPRVAARHDPSTSSLHINLAPGQRPPSAYLDDLLMDDPSTLPPPQMPPSSGPRRAGSPANRF